MSRIDGAPYDTSVTDILAAAHGVAATLQAECATFLARARLETFAFSLISTPGLPVEASAGIIPSGVCD